MDTKKKEKKSKPKASRGEDCMFFVMDPCGFYMVDPCGCYVANPCCC